MDAGQIAWAVLWWLIAAMTGYLAGFVASFQDWLG